MSPKAGAHGELCGMMAIKAAHRGARRGRDAPASCWCRNSAHGTNPATAALVGFSVRSSPAPADGTVDARRRCARRSAPDVAAIMLTNPNTCGLFEREIVEIAEAVHEAGAYFYCDGANFNAIVGKVRPGDLGIDAMHINLHKTFSTPHGGGGPGAGPVVLSERSRRSRPCRFVVREGDALRPGRACARARESFGRMMRLPRPDGHVRARADLHSSAMARDGLRQASRGRGAVGQLHPRLAQGSDERAVRRSGPACTRRCSTTAC